MRVWHAILSLWRHPSMGRSIRYMCMTGVSVCLTFGITVGLHEGLGASERISGGVALFCAFLINFVTARRIVFSASGSWRRQALRFALTSAGFRGGEYIIFVFLIDVIDLYYILSLGISLGMSLVLKYFVYKYWVFGDGSSSGLARRAR